MDLLTSTANVPTRTNDVPYCTLRASIVLARGPLTARSRVSGELRRGSHLRKDVSGTPLQPSVGRALSPAGSEDNSERPDQFRVPGARKAPFIGVVQSLPDTP